jgi:hypothetical protein
MAASVAAHGQPSHINLPSASPSSSASPTRNVPGNQQRGCGSYIEMSGLPLKHTSFLLDITNLAGPAPMLQEKRNELRNMRIDSPPSTTETCTTFAAKQLAPADLGESSEAVSSILPAQGFSPESRSMLGTLTPGHPKPTANATSRGTSFATRATVKDKVGKKPPRTSKSRYRTGLTAISSGSTPKVQPSIKTYVPSYSHGKCRFTLR